MEIHLTMSCSVSENTKPLLKDKICIFENPNPLHTLPNTIECNTVEMQTMPNATKCNKMQQNAISDFVAMCRHVVCVRNEQGCFHNVISITVLKKEY